MSVTLPKFSVKWLAFYGLSLLLLGCDLNKQEAVPKAPVENKPDASIFAAQVGLMAYTSLSSASRSAQSLDSKLASFMYHPNPMSQTEIQQAWRAAYDDFLKTLIFAQLPIQDPPDWYKERIAYQDILQQLDSWPMQGGYIDYVQGYPFSGIVNDLTLELTEPAIRSQHRFTDETNGSLGYHSLEFMIWGENGDRSPKDFFPQENTAPVPMNDARNVHSEVNSNTEDDSIPSNQENTDAEGTIKVADIKPQNHNRRRQYTQLVSELLQKDLHRVQRRWEPSSGYYAQLLQQSSSDNTLQAALIAAQNLLSKEVLGKRFSYESSEFSNGSALDIAALLAGLIEWFKPTEGGQQEGSMHFLMEQANPEKSALLFQALTDSQSCLIESESVAGRLSTADTETCKQHVLSSLSALRNMAIAMQVSLPALD